MKIRDGVLLSIAEKDVKNGHLVIPEGVTAIDNNVCSKKKIKYVTLPESLVFIYDWAFAQNELTKIIIPDNVIRIFERAFHDNYINNIEIGKKEIKISDYAFSCNKLKEVIIPKNVTDLGENAFIHNPLTKFSVKSDNYTAITLNTKLVLVKKKWEFDNYCLYEGNIFKGIRYQELLLESCYVAEKKGHYDIGKTQTQAILRLEGNRFCGTIF